MIRLFATVVFACWAGIALGQGAAQESGRKTGASQGAAQKNKVRALSKQAFTEKVAQELATKFAGTKFSVAGELTIIRIERDGKESEVSLDNLYRDYTKLPADFSALVASFAAALAEGCSAGCGPLDRTRIVPIIKDRAWIEDNRQRLKKQAAELDFVFEDFNDELVVVYVQDSKHRMRYLMANEDLGIERGELRQLAVDNLARLLPNIEIRTNDRLSLISAGGNYEASLLLLDSFWHDGTINGEVKVNGDIVVAIPAKDILLVGGSKDRKSLSAMRDLAAKFAAEGSHPISDKLFVYRDGRFVKFGRK
jgi:uncharacterized protein YtpQ (UPF0354 family)